jgi:hypothetical protein
MIHLTFLKSDGKIISYIRRSIHDKTCRLHSSVLTIEVDSPAAIGKVDVSEQQNLRGEQLWRLIEDHEIEMSLLRNLASFSIRLSR